MSTFSFELRTPEDLLEKMKRELKRCDCAINQNDRQGACDHALNFAISAWSMADWLWASGCVTSLAPNKKKFKIWVKTNSTDLSLCADIANGTKHFELRNDNSNVKNTIISQDFKRSSGLSPPVTRSVTRPISRALTESEHGNWHLCLKLETTNAEIVDIMDIFPNIIKFWDKIINQHR